MAKQNKFTKSARGEECTLRLFPYCGASGPDTVVLCHLPSEDKGMGIKSPDWWAVYGCDRCHAIIDGRWSPQSTPIYPEDIQEAYLRGLFLTHKKMIEKGLIKV